MDANTVIVHVALVILMVLSLTVHEWAHAFSAFQLGDPTARDQGRLTLNPLVHIDLFGTILLPLFGVPFGWAKPVPFDPRRFDRKFSVRTGTMITKAAGPISNLVLATLCAVLLGLVFRGGAAASMNSALVVFLEKAIELNLSLAVFNLLPIEPLDGAGVVDRFVPDTVRPMWDQFRRISPMLLMFMLIGPMLLGSNFGVFRLMDWPMGKLFQFLQSIVSGIGGDG